MEEEPPKWSGINGMCVGSGDGMNPAYLEVEEVGFVVVFKVTLPIGMEVRGVVVGGGQDEANAIVLKVAGAVFGIRVEEGGTNVKRGGGCWWWVVCGVPCRLGGGGWWEILCQERSLSKWKNRVGAVGQEAW
jgi:hypothetical protein